MIQKGNVSTVKLCTVMCAMIVVDQNPGKDRRGVKNHANEKRKKV